MKKNKDQTNLSNHLLEIIFMQCTDFCGLEECNCVIYVGWQIENIHINGNKVYKAKKLQTSL